VENPSNAEQGAPIEAEPTGKSDDINSAAPQQVVRRHGSAKPID
jgi:hypothetical protein